MFVYQNELSSFLNCIRVLQNLFKKKKNQLNSFDISAEHILDIRSSLFTEQKVAQSLKEGKRKRIGQQSSPTVYLPVYQELLACNKLWSLLLCSINTVKAIQIDLHYKCFTWGQRFWSLAMKQSSPLSFSYDMSRIWGQGGTLYRWIIVFLGSVFIQQWVTYPWQRRGLYSYW